MRVIITFLFALFAFVGLVVACMIMVFCFVLSWPFDRKKYVMHLFSYIFSQIFIHMCPLWRFDIRGRENIDKKKAYVVTSNHQSMFDIILLYMALGGLQGRFVSKKEVYRIPFFGWALWMRGDIAIDRSSSSAYGKVLIDGGKCLRDGISVLIFPEGTRSKDGEVHRFKEGAFSLAKQTGVEILPCVMDGTRNLSSGWLLNKRLMQVDILPPVGIEQVQESSPQEMARRVQEITSIRLKEMRNRK